MRLPRNHIRRNIVVLVCAGTGGIWGLLREWPADWTQLAVESIWGGIAWAIAAYWALVWLWPRRTRGTPIGAIMGAAISLVVSSLLPDLIFSAHPYEKIMTIGVYVFFGTLVGAFAGTAPHGAFIGAGLGAIACIAIAGGMYLLTPSTSSTREYTLEGIPIVAFVGLLFGGGIGGYFELDKRGKATTPHP